MLVTIHQPEHLPYYGLLSKIANADIYVVLDDVDYSKHNFQNRNKISTSYGPKWLTIPVKNTAKLINEKETVSNWKTRYRNIAVECYRKHPYYTQGLQFVDNMLSQNSNLLVDYNMCYINQLIDELGIKTKIVMSSSLNITTTKSQRLFDICNSVGAKKYLAGSASSNYLDKSLFDGNIDVITHQFSYPALMNPYMSSLDHIMCLGIDYLKESLVKNSNAFA